MDLTHSMAGWALGQAGLKTKTRKGLAALILGANMPDIDVFFGNAPWDPLAIHRGFTHGLVGGVLVMPPILAGLLWLLDRWHARGASSSRAACRCMPVADRAVLPRRGHAPLARLADDLFGPAALAHFGALVPCRCCSSSTFGCGCCWPSPSVSKRREQRGREWRRFRIRRDRGPVRLHRPNLLITQRANAAVRDWAAARPGRCLLASPPPVEF